MSQHDDRQLRLTLRTLLAYLDDTLPPLDARQIGQKLAHNEGAQELVERIKKVTRRRGLSTPPPTTFGKNSPSDPNVVAGYLSDALTPEVQAEFERTCLESDMHLAEVAACHQILTLVLCEQIRVPPTSYRRMYSLVQGPESNMTREPGQGIPVGGIYADTAAPVESDGSSSSYLLGLQPPAGTPSPRKRMARWSVVALSLAGFLYATWMVWPKPQVELSDQQALAMLPARTTKVPPTGAPPTTAKSTEPTKVSVEPAKTPVKQVETPVKPVEAPLEPAKTPVKPVEAPLVGPEVLVGPKLLPPVELVPDRVPVKPGEVAIGVLESPEQAVLIARLTQAAAWSRLLGKDAQVRTESRVVCLPGYKARIKLENGGAVEFWGNLPDLLPLPIYETAANFHVPYDGYAADMTLHTGRVYLSTSQPAGTKMRIRVQNEIWDLTIPDAKTELAVEVVHRLVPGRLAETPEATITLHVVKGTAGLKVRYKEVPQIAAGETVFWSNKGRGLEGPFKPEAELGRGSSYFSRIPVYPNEALARPVLESMDDFAKRLTDRTRVRAMLAELIREQPEITSRTLADGRLGVLSYAAIGELDVLVELLGDGMRHPLRQNAVSALRIALATHPNREEDFRKLATQKLGLTADQTEEVMRLLRGASTEDRQTPEFIDGMISGLSSPALAIRELSFAVLVFDIDPASQKVQRLMQYNAAAPADTREPIVRAWAARAIELKKPKEVVKEPKGTP